MGCCFRMDLIALTVNFLAYPFPLCSGRTRAEHKYKASYFVLRGVVYKSSCSLICFDMNCFIESCVVGTTNTHAIGPFFVLLSVNVAGWSRISRAIDFESMEICVGSFFVWKNSPASLIIRSKFSFLITLSLLKLT